jgi:hypothetical protein
VDGFDGGAFSNPDFDNVNYDIVLTGVGAPEPATVGMAGATLLAFVIALRRRKARA